MLLQQMIPVIKFVAGETF